MSVYAVSGIFFKLNMVQRINMFFSLFMIAMCLVFVYFAAFTKLLDYKLEGNLIDEKLQGNLKPVFISIMLVYGDFRTYGLVKAYRTNNNENFE